MTAHPSYPAGQCTRYAADTWGPAVGAYWGDGRAWLAAAAAAGYATASAPVAGALAVWGPNMGGTGPAGHVAIVTRANPLTVRESNWLASLRVDARAVDAASEAGIIGYVLPAMRGTALTDAERGDLASGVVAHLYSSILHRDADADVAGRDFWYGQILTHGFGLATRAFLTNPESRADIAAEAAGDHNAPS